MSIKFSTKIFSFATKVYIVSRTTSSLCGLGKSRVRLTARHENPRSGFSRAFHNISRARFPDFS